MSEDEIRADERAKVAKWLIEMSDLTEATERDAASRAPAGSVVIRLRDMCEVRILAAALMQMEESPR